MEKIFFRKIDLIIIHEFLTMDFSVIAGRRI